jgi:uncharacterized protein YodC (DUF2158 family)
MANSSFKPGDVVELRSGSVPMTINSVGDDGAVVCHYFDFTKHEMVTVTLTAAELKISSDA